MLLLYGCYSQSGFVIIRPVVKEACSLVQSDDWWLVPTQSGGSGFAVDWNPICMKNQMSSRYRMYIKLSYEFVSEWGPRWAWVESIIALHNVMIMQMKCLWIYEYSCMIVWVWMWCGLNVNTRCLRCISDACMTM